MFHLVFTLNRYKKSVTRTFLGRLFWAPIPFKTYQNTSGCGTALFLLRYVKAASSSLERICCGFLLYCLNEDNAVYLIFVFLLRQNL